MQQFSCRRGTHGTAYTTSECTVFNGARPDCQAKKWRMTRQVEVPGEQLHFASENTFALLHEQNLNLCSTPALSTSTANTVHAIQHNANDNGTKSIEQNLQNFHSAIMHSKSCENMNSQVACCIKHNRAFVACEAVCSAACMAQHIY